MSLCGLVYLHVFTIWHIICTFLLKVESEDRGVRFKPQTWNTTNNTIIIELSLQPHMYIYIINIIILVYGKTSSLKF